MHDESMIASVIGALAVHVDGRDWPALEALFAPQVEVDYTSLFGGEAQALARGQLIATWRALLPGFTYTNHLIGTPMIAVSGAKALAKAKVTARHVVQDGGRPELLMAGGCYEIALVKDEGRWRIAALTLARAWQEGNLALPQIAAERAARA